MRVALVAEDGSRSGWDAQGTQRLREALAAWNATGLPFRLVATGQWLESDIRIVVVRQLPEDPAAEGPMAHYRAGFTRLAHDERGGIVRAQVAIAEQSSDRTSYTVPDQVSTLLHELGHALGLPHAKDAMALMAAYPRVEAITTPDLRLLRRVYDTACRSPSRSIATR